MYTETTYTITETTADLQRFVGQSIQYRTNMRTKVTLSNVSKQIPVRGTTERTSVEGSTQDHKQQTSTLKDLAAAMISVMDFGD